jgi:hypothetical protein
MIILLTIIFILAISLCFSQTKEQLIDIIIKVNRVESNCTGIACTEGSQYKRFQKLKKKLSNEELIKLSEHENPTIRTYALIEIIQTNKGNFKKLLATEIQKYQMVESFYGCIIDVEPVSSILFREYWEITKIEDSRKIKGNNYEQDL